MTTSTYESVQVSIPDVVATNGNGARSSGTVGLLWRSDRPYAVTLLAKAARGGLFVSWTLDRETLAEGLDGPAGLGDYSVLPDLTQQAVPRVEIVLSGNTSGVGRNASLPLPVVLVEEFLERTYAVVPLGAEQLDVDPSQIGGEKA